MPKITLGVLAIDATGIFAIASLVSLVRGPDGPGKDCSQHPALLGAVTPERCNRRTQVPLKRTCQASTLVGQLGKDPVGEGPTQETDESRP
eukprot:1249456-Alexandrium_andersonii.AAC.1